MESLIGATDVNCVILVVCSEPGGADCVPPEGTHILLESQANTRRDKMYRINESYSSFLPVLYYNQSAYRNIDSWILGFLL